MKKRILFILSMLIVFSSFSQTNVKKNYTKPYFQANVKVRDTLGVDSVLKLNEPSYIIGEDEAGPRLILKSTVENDSTLFASPLTGALSSGNALVGFVYTKQFDYTSIYSPGDVWEVRGTQGGVNDGTYTLTGVAYDAGNTRTEFQWAGMYDTTTAPYGSFVPQDGSTYWTLGDANNYISSKNQGVYLQTNKDYIQIVSGDVVNINAKNSFQQITNEVITYGLWDNLFTRYGGFEIWNNLSGNVSSTAFGSAGVFPSFLSSKGSTINQNIVNSVVLGGAGLLGDKDNTVFVPNLEIQTGKEITSSNGNGIIDMDNGGVGNLIIKDGSGSLLIGDGTLTMQAGNLGVDVTSQITMTTSLNSFSLFNAAFTKQGEVITQDNDTGNVTSSAIAKFPTIVASQTGTVNTGVINSVLLGGVNLVADKNNTVFVPDLEIQSGKTITSSSGTTELDLNSSPGSIVDSNGFFLGNENGFVSLDNFGSGIKAINIQNVRDTSQTNGAYSMYYTFFGNTYLWQADKRDVSPANHREGGYNIYANLASDGIVTNGTVDAPPSSSSVSQAIAKQGVKNTFGAGARYITMKTDNSFYTNQLILQKGSPTTLFETRLNSVTPTADRDILLQDADGTLALTSQLLENTDITIDSNRTITANAGFTINEFGTGVNISSSNNNITITPQATTGTVIVGTGANDSSAILQINSTKQGFLPPAMTTVQRDSIGTPAEGLMIANTSTNSINYYNGTSWKELVEYETDTVHPYGGTAVTSSSETSIDTSGIYYKLAGTTTQTNAASNVDASTTNNRIVYNGAAMKHFHIVGQSSITIASGNNLDISIEIWVFDSSAGTGSLLAHSKANNTMGSIDVEQITTHGDVMLDTGDYIELHVANNTNTNNVTAEELYLFMMGM